MRTLTLIDKAFLLKKTTLFGSLDLDLLLTIADKLGSMNYKLGDIIFSRAQDASVMYLIANGTVAIECGKNQVRLLKGEFFGDESVFNEKARAYTATCAEAATLLTLSRNHLLGIIAECPSVAVALLEAYSARVDFRDR